MDLTTSAILCISTILLVSQASSLNPPPNNAPPSPVSNAAPSNNLSPPSDNKAEGANPENNQPANGPLINNNGNETPSGTNNAVPNGNVPKPITNGQQTGAPNNLPNVNGNNMGTNINNESPNISGALNNAAQPNAGANNVGKVTTRSNVPIGSNGQNLSGTNSSQPGSIKDTHHPIGKSAKQTQNHPELKGKADTHKGQHNGAMTTVSIKPAQIFVVVFVSLITKHIFQLI